MVIFQGCEIHYSLFQLNYSVIATPELKMHQLILDLEWDAFILFSQIELAHAIAKVIDGLTVTKKLFALHWVAPNILVILYVLKVFTFASA